MPERIRAQWPYLVGLLTIVAEWALLSPQPALGDHFQFWAAGRIILDGRSPYDRDAWASMAAYGPLPGGVTTNTVIGNLELTRYVWLYPPALAFALVPFGALPLAVGIPLLHLTMLLGALWGVAASAREAGLRGARLAVALVLVLLSQPFVIGVRDGHPLGFVLAGATCAYVGARDRRPLLLALGAILVSLKPHVALAFAVGLMIVLVRRREWKLMAWAAAALALVSGGALAARPFPLEVLTAASDERLALDISNVAALSRDLGAGSALVLPLVAIALVAAAIATRTAPPARRAVTAFAASLALSLVVAPYAHDYDMLLAVPASFVGLTLARGTRYEATLSAGFGALLGPIPWILFFWWPLVGQDDRAYQAGLIGALPLLALATLALASTASRRAVSRGYGAREGKRDGPYATSR